MHRTRAGNRGQARSDAIGASGGAVSSVGAAAACV
jgi:hypothetical protein